jgi:hypothetical protein
MTDAITDLAQRLADLEQRLDRVESEQAIARLAHQYALFADSRNLEALLMLFVDDVNCGRLGVGRDALRASYEIVHRQFYRTVHQVVGHTVDFHDADHAEGTVTMRAEHEVKERWIVGMMTLFDTYERRDGAWYYVRRRPESWYSIDYEDMPEGPSFAAPDWGAPGRGASLPGKFPSWATFWSGHDDRVAELTDHPIES